MAANNSRNKTEERAFGEVAEAYAEYRPSYPDELYQHLEFVGGPFESAWDCATGNGQAAVDLTRIADSVVATDVDERQLAAAVDHPDVDYRVASAEDSGLPDASMDLVTVATALHWFDLDAFFAELDRVLAPGGLFAAWCYNTVDVNYRIDSVIARLTDEILDDDWDPRVRHIQNEYADIDLPIEDLEPPELCCTMEWTFEDFTGFLSTWSAYRDHQDRYGEESLDSIRRELAEAWGPPEKRRTAEVPLFVRIGRKPE